MHRPLQVTVTAQDIDDAIQDGIDNPLARALNRATGTNWDVVVGHRYAYEVESPYRLILLPPEIVIIISRWRAFQPIAPFDFSCEYYTNAAPAGLSNLSKNSAHKTR
jgi:hypothetical protein